LSSLDEFKISAPSIFTAEFCCEDSVLGGDVDGSCLNTRSIIFVMIFRSYRNYELMCDMSDLAAGLFEACDNCRLSDVHVILPFCLLYPAGSGF
jgi:hypothetical protein